MYDNKEILIETIVKAMPYPNQIKDWDITNEATSVRFTWRGKRFRVNTSGGVEEVQGGVLVGSDLAILVSAILKKQRYEDI